MREIKFRVWWPMAKLMEEVWDLNWLITDGVDVNKAMDDRSYKLMQFTGLKDKNGKEIYEGDVVRDAYKAVDVVTYGTILDGVSGDPRAIGFNVNSWDGYEVIGNIYENPELLPAEIAQ